MVLSYTGFVDGVVSLVAHVLGFTFHQVRELAVMARETPHWKDGAPLWRDWVSQHRHDQFQLMPDLRPVAVTEERLQGSTHSHPGILVRQHQARYGVYVTVLDICFLLQSTCLHFWYRTLNSYLVYMLVMS